MGKKGGRLHNQCICFCFLHLLTTVTATFEGSLRYDNSCLIFTLWVQLLCSYVWNVSLHVSSLHSVSPLSMLSWKYIISRLYLLQVSVMVLDHVILHFDLYSTTYECRWVRRSLSRTRDIGLNHGLRRLRFDFLLFKIFSPAINALED